ncbi:MAG: glutamate synthase subunit beta [Rikenellaceae bacterium]
MGNPKAFLSIKRKEAGYRPVQERIHDFGEVEQTLNEEDRQLQASRCMDCGVPFCHWSCPLGNKQPEWQEMVYKGKWKEAAQILLETDDFPEFTGRICPALCEKGCVLNKTKEAVTVRENEVAIIEKAFAEGYIVPFIPKKRTGKTVAVIGSGPSGLAVANQLNRKGHSVTVFEKNEYAGGLVRLGIPDFKLSKAIVERRIKLMEQEGVTFKYNQEIGVTTPAKEILDNFDAVCVTIGSGQPRDLANVEGRSLKGVYFALEFLQQQNRVIAGQTFSAKDRIDAKDKHVLVIGGGDTGSDCIGTANRQGAAKVTQIEIMPKPPVDDNPDTPWPYYPIVLKTSSSHKEGCDRFWSLDTKRFIGEGGVLKEVEVVEVNWEKTPEGRMNLVKTDNIRIIKADLVFLAMGFVNPVFEGLLEQLGVELTDRKNVAVNKAQQSSVEKVFAAGDAAMGASLVVRAIASGRDAAKGIDAYLSK